MKKIVLFLSLILAFQFVNAQSPINIGLKAGYSSSQIKTNLEQFNEGSVSNYFAGAFARLNLGKIYIQPEAYFSSKGGKLNEVVESPTATVNSFDLKAIDVPVLLGYKVIEKGAFNLRINAGPVLSFFTKKETNNEETFDPNDLKDNFFGYQYGAGVDFLFLSLDVRAENSFGDIYSGSSDEKSQTFLVSLGIKLL